ncbi:ABC transporter permease [Streptomyces prunicolor]|jgi:NitT/TauT family transport system permease protein|uniref:ABC transporter permease n=1 Tax=Streptomyces prunicolor TaxID=67348 RepID=A0ABU4FMA4_9ACTN|nr:ABC transporter permease [Streptomyces prunicolor]MCX5238537.1 ABC transporter permease [Streptomyces prunicolor]MDV7221123.1 ABC transporter permease [Streptomyces prunicolor]
MASSETKTTDSVGGAAAGTLGQIISVEAGLDALDLVVTSRPTFRQTFVNKIFPPIVALAVVMVVWFILTPIVDDPTKLPSPGAVGGEFKDAWLQGNLLGYIWTSVSRGLLGFFFALLIGTPLGLVVARVKFIRAAIGPILSGLQSLPSVAWVPPAVIWLGLNNSMMYTVILLGAVPSIANGLVSGVDQVPPLFLRAGRTMGATGIKGIWHVTLPAALPGYVAGLKQGWAFSWRSLMAAEIIANFPDLGVGLGQLLENGRTASDMAMVFEAIVLILFVGIAIDLLLFSPLERWVLRSRGLLVKS